ncbi:uncharacterized protein [Channa argus]|uniref:uncharacterized protein isoform X2 n=1 Tax=Channa argus TaxID=215402 RepID=UPI00352158DC
MRQRRTMAEFRQILMVLFLILMIHFTVTGQRSYFTVRDGDDVTLPCVNVRDGQNKCDRTDWMLGDRENTKTVILVTRGQIETVQIPKSKSDRLSVTENCSLVIRKVTDEDVGRYTCRQQQVSDSVVDVSVVTMTEHKQSDKILIYCSVSTHKDSKPSVKWLFQGKHEHHNDVSASPTKYYATVLFPDSHFTSSSVLNSLKCEVTDPDGKVQQFPFRLQSSGDHTKPQTTEATATTGGDSGPTTASISAAAPNLLVVWLLVSIVGLITILIIVAMVHRYKRGKGKKMHMNENNALSLNPAQPQSGPETSQDTTDPEDEVSYASISFTKKTNSKVQVQSYDEGDEVTYSSVKTSSYTARTLNQFLFPE